MYGGAILRNAKDKPFIGIRRICAISSNKTGDIGVPSCVRKGDHLSANWHATGIGREHPIIIYIEIYAVMDNGAAISPAPEIRIEKTSLRRGRNRGEGNSRKECLLNSQHNPKNRQVYQSSGICFAVRRYYSNQNQSCIAQTQVPQRLSTQYYTSVFRRPKQPH